MSLPTQPTPTQPTRPVPNAPNVPATRTGQAGQNVPSGPSGLSLQPLQPLQSRRGALARAWVHVFGEADPIERQLAAVAREGAALARIAHACAFLMLLLFSAGSLVALAGESVQQIAAGHVTIPAVIAAGVSALLVACMDCGMLYAASTIRLLASRRAARSEGAVHWFVLIGVAILEAATYAYMSWKYESPHDGGAWALIVARALAAPLLSVYLSLARPLPVTARDMLALAERIAGEGVLHDLAAIAGETSASLAEKVALYIAAAVIAPSDRSRLDALLGVAQQRASQDISGMALERAERAEGTEGHDSRLPGRGALWSPHLFAHALRSRQTCSVSRSQPERAGAQPKRAEGVRTGRVFAPPVPLAAYVVVRSPRASRRRRGRLGSRV